MNMTYDRISLYIGTNTDMDLSDPGFQILIYFNTPLVILILLRLQKSTGNVIPYCQQTLQYALVSVLYATFAGIITSDLINVESSQQAKNEHCISAFHQMFFHLTVSMRKSAVFLPCLTD